MEIRDPIHGNIEINETVQRIIDTKEMQRLRYVKQLDTTYLIFPGANHTRFEHSLGTMHVTKELSSLIYGDEKEEMQYVGLLHDIGHGPFSHLSEHFIKEYLKMNHEQLGEYRIRNSEIKDALSDAGLSFNKVIHYFRDADNIAIVGGPLGADRIDYLMRDSHYTGVAYGLIDYERIKGRLCPYKDKVAVSESGISGAESMLIARYFMYTNVYMHHAKAIANKMLQRAIGTAMEQDIFNGEELALMDDGRLIETLSNSKINDVAELTQRVLERRLFKRVYYGNVSHKVDTAELEKMIIDSGVKRNEFIAHYMSFRGTNERINVVDRNNKLVGDLTDVSQLIKTLDSIFKESSMLLVASDKRNAEKINGVVRKFVVD